MTHAVHIVQYNMRKRTYYLPAYYYYYAQNNTCINVVGFLGNAINFDNMRNLTFTNYFKHIVNITMIIVIGINIFILLLLFTKEP